MRWTNKQAGFERKRGDSQVEQASVSAPSLGANHA